MNISNPIRYITGAQGSDTMGAIDDQNNFWIWGGDASDLLPGSGPYLPFILATHTVDIAISLEHILKLDEFGVVSCMGQNNYGQCGWNNPLLGTYYTSFFPVRYLPPNIIKLEVSTIGSFVLNENGDVYSWGYNFFDELGYQQNDRIFQPLPSLRDYFIKEYHSSQSNIWVLSTNGHIYFGGIDTGYILGQQSNYKTHFLVPVNYKIQSFFASEENIQALTYTNELVFLGVNDHGEYGDNTTLTQTSFTLLNASGLWNSSMLIKKMVGHENLFGFLTKDQRLFFSGKNSKRLSPSSSINLLEKTLWTQPNIDPSQLLVKDVAIETLSLYVLTESQMLFASGDISENPIGLGDSSNIW
eukprot:CAMPEP_0117423766 /NCGR_PEP_ID=MMETSP0758-20121206/4314_1 /TAXON_ID=63605 /ORGANISM="Percolomonas cosmopolitus, Strain AE-1 (ATCC 50343)" /LENGTH=356 /DNA_ID=CAMNT_0005207131 /DNA_START=1137 /DNA_END=2204 /DNA_ORIENTATION=-